MNILVTGCAGFIGSHVCRALIARGDRVIGVDNLNDYYDVSLKKARLGLCQEMTFFQGDVCDHEFISKIVTTHKIDKICHLAAQAGVRYSLEKPFSYEEANGKGMLSILEVCRQYHLPLVYASSSSVYGSNTKIPFSEVDEVNEPESLYAATKRYNELQAKVYFKLFSVKSIGLRFFTVYGPYGRPDMAPFIFTSKILSGEPISVFNRGEMYRDFTFVSDIVAGVVAALDSNLNCEVINLCRGEKVPLMDFIRAIEKASGVSAKLEFKPMQKGDVLVTYGDSSKAKALLGYSPQVSVNDGVKSFVQWYKEYYGV